ncbi:hypothetical protein CICLE_v10033900mg, partial [Citrus x clementina]
VQVFKNILQRTEIATNGFRTSNKIGEGGFGSVYKGRLEDGTVVAVKVLSVESKQGETEFMSEVASMANINICHENLFSLLLFNRYSVYIHEDVQFLSDYLKPVAADQMSDCPHDSLTDIKANNILLDQNFNPKISKFGLYKLFPENITHISTHAAGTLGYLAPEYAITGRLTCKSDVYSFGGLLLEIFGGRTAVDFDIEKESIFYLSPRIKPRGCFTLFKKISTKNKL